MRFIHGFSTTVRMKRHYRYSQTIDRRHPPPSQSKRYLPSIGAWPVVIVLTREQGAATRHANGNSASRGIDRRREHVHMASRFSGFKPRNRPPTSARTPAAQATDFLRKYADAAEASLKEPLTGITTPCGGMPERQKQWPLG